MAAQCPHPTKLVEPGSCSRYTGFFSLFLFFINISRLSKGASVISLRSQQHRVSRMLFPALIHTTLHGWGVEPSSVDSMSSLAEFFKMVGCGWEMAEVGRSRYITRHLFDDHHDVRCKMLCVFFHPGNDLRETAVPS